MPRNKNKPTEFIAGPLPKVTIDGEQFYVDGRMQELRRLDDASRLEDQDMVILIALSEGSISKEDYYAICFEFFGEEQPDINLNQTAK